MPNGTFLVLAPSPLAPWGAFRVIVGGTQDYDGKTLEMQTSISVETPHLVESSTHLIEEESAVTFVGIHPSLGDAYRIRVLDAEGIVVADSGTIALKGVGGPGQGGGGGGGGGGACLSRGGTNAREKGWQGGSVSFDDDNYFTNAVSLGYDAVESTWEYQDAWQTGPWVEASDAGSYGHGFHGRNSFEGGHEYDTAMGASWLGNSVVHTNSDCGGSWWGYSFHLSDAQVFYRDVDGVIANHGSAWERGRASESCSSTMNSVLKSALDLTKYGGFIEPLIPDKTCVKNWEQLVTAGGRSGRGVEMSRTSGGSYEGGHAFVRTLYSTSGLFYMEFDGYVYYSGAFKACAACYQTTIDYWTGLSSSSNARVL